MVTVVMPMPMLLLPLAPFPLIFQPRQRPRDLLPLLLHQKLLHRIVLVMIPDQLLQLHLLLNHGPSLLVVLLLLLTVLFPLLFTGCSPLQIPLPLLFLLAIFPLVARMVHFQYPSHDAGAAEIIHGQVRRALIFIFQECEAFAFSGFFVPDEVYVGRFAELGEDG